ncbi:MAG: L-threonylcarbamoyladenylate synthase [Defluviitaleaceae bacterium]|nr:L-threonylcarbamoyladenylate synthase [Defluviitaleaceae bacterium]
MKTIVARILSLNDAAMAEAADIIKNGGLVALPTETVYGLGANALDEAACAKVYAVKGRPSDNPLIMHISDVAMLDSIAKNVPPMAEKLIQTFWPGPLTVILQRKNVPRGTFLDTVAVRMPKNPIALRLIDLAKTPIAAPSANLSGRPSPTTAGHVLRDLSGKIDMILDGGPCEVGLESTVIDCSGDGAPVILRPGSVTREMIEGLIGPVGMATEAAKDEAPKSPGMKYRHYAPEAKLTVVVGEAEKVRAKIQSLATDTEKIGIMATAESAYYYKHKNVLIMGDSHEAIAANLFDMLRLCDEMGLEEVFVEGVAEEGLGVAIMNRLKKAASYNILKV